MSHPDAPTLLSDLVPFAARRWPTEEALVGDDERLTWEQVDERTRRLAGVLVGHGVAPGDRVAVARIKSHESFEAVHAILRAGAAVVPIDPLAPPAAARSILADADVTAVIGDTSTIEPIDPWSVIDGVACVVATGPTDDDRIIPWSDAVSAGDDVEPVTIDPDGVAYLVYTSGSTGRPKGIVHTHRSGITYARTAAEAHGIRRDDRVAGMCPLHFDMSTLELYVAPLVGACVVTMSDSVMRFPASLSERCAVERVSVWYTVPSVLDSLVRRGGLDRRDLGSVRWIGYGGEPYPGAALRRLMAALPGAEVVNVYGPAEVNACTFHVLDGPPDGDEVPIGRPWPAAEVRVVDDAGRDVPPGTAGELLVSATTAMREYWRQPELTRRRLLPRPDGPPWYVTGDVVEQDPDGMLWFRGRIDSQVKVRGARVELDAIEAVIASAPGVAQAVAVAVDRGGAGDATRIVAAIVPEDGEEVTVGDLRAWCARELSPATIPRSVTIFPAFPQTQSGKIDRRRVRRDVVDRLSAPPEHEEHHGATN